MLEGHIKKDGTQYGRIQETSIGYLNKYAIFMKKKKKIKSHKKGFLEKFLEI